MKERLQATHELAAFYRRMLQHWGPQHWWPAQSRFEVIVGAYLTQNTSWTNVERAIRNLRAAHCLSPQGIRQTPLPELEELVRPSGYFRQKALRLKKFMEFLDLQYGGSLNRMFAQPTATLREQLLALNGVGPETADSILLYAGDHPVFVVDAYTRRILARHGLVAPDANYEEIRAICEESLRAAGAADASPERPAYPNTGNPRHRPSRVSRGRRGELAQRYNEMHALLVGVAKNYCHKAAPRCQACPLEEFLNGKNRARATNGHKQTLPDQ